LVNFYFQHKVIYCSHVWNHTYGSSKLIITITSHWIEVGSSNNNQTIENTVKRMQEFFANWTYTP
jgi:hypothetical protein